MTPSVEPTPEATLTATATLRPNTSASAVAANQVQIAVGVREIAGLGGRALANRLRDALSEQMPGIEFSVVDEDRLDSSALVVTVDNPAPDFSVRVVASIPQVLVTSPRLSLRGISSEQAAGLMTGEVTDWRLIGAVPTLPVKVLALRGTDVDSVDPVETFRTYDALAEELDDTPGGVALVPLDQVDFRVNVLAIDGVDPLRGEGAVVTYPFGDRLYVGVRPEHQSLLQSEVDAALASLNLPRQANPVASLAFAGDVRPSQGEDDLDAVFAEIAPMLSRPDLTIASFGRVPDEATAAPTTPVAATRDASVALAAAGIDVVTLANQWSFANGEAGFALLRENLREAGVAWFGAGDDLAAARAPFIGDIDGVRVAVIGVNGITANRDSALPGVTGNRDAANARSPGTNPLIESRLRADVEAATDEADIVVVYLTGGVAGRATPPAWTIAAAHEAVKAGADLVVVSHPGLPGAVETYQGKPILYSLGHLVSDGLGGVETRQGIVAELTLRGETIVGLRLHGVVTGDDGRPRPMTDTETAMMLDRVWWLTDQLSANG